MSMNSNIWRHQLLTNLDPGTAILYMKVGTHANEGLEAIIARKQREIEEAGVAFWGYGGSTCHPTTMVQPFAERLALSGTPLILAMQPMNSKHFAEPVRAEEYSVDGTNWQSVPHGVNALGSRYALVLDSLEQTHLDFPSTRPRSR